MNTAAGLSTTPIGRQIGPAAGARAALKAHEQRLEEAQNYKRLEGLFGSSSTCADAEGEGRNWPPEGPPKLDWRPNPFPPDAPADDGETRCVREGGLDDWSTRGFCRLADAD